MSDSKGLNWAQVRHLIASGTTRDKVKGFDPAAAPLGTDDEAAGFPTQPLPIDGAFKG
jgi:hypothetical protein